MAPTNCPLATALAQSGASAAELERHVQNCATCQFHAPATIPPGLLADQPAQLPVQAEEPPRPSPEATISHFGAYRVVRLLGAGAMGLVYEAEDVQLLDGDVGRRELLGFQRDLVDREEPALPVRELRLEASRRGVKGRVDRPPREG